MTIWNEAHMTITLIFQLNELCNQWENETNRKNVMNAMTLFSFSTNFLFLVQNGLLFSTLFLYCRSFGSFRS